MTQGDILKLEGLKTQQFTIKANTDITKGMLYYDDGAGLVAVTAAAAALSKPVMALETKVYATDTTNGVSHVVNCVKEGYVEAAKVSSGGIIPPLAKLTISATSGKVGLFAKGTVSQSNTYATATDQAALDANLALVGYAVESSVDADTTQKMWLGK